MEEPKAVFGLMNALRDEERLVKESAVDALGKIGYPAIMPLINALKEEEWFIKSDVEMALAKIGKPAVKPIIKFLENCNESFFQSAATILGKIGDEQAVTPLISALYIDNPIIRDSATAALGKIGDKRAVQPIVDIINKYGCSLGTARALVELRHPVAIPYLLAMLKGDERWFAAEMLGKFGVLAVDPLSSLLKDKDINKQGVVAAALGFTGVGEAVGPLINALKDDDPIAVWRAASALVEIGENSVGDLIQQLHNESGYIRLLAADSLGRIGDRRAITPLEEIIMSETDHEVRRWAVKALEKLKNDDTLPSAKNKQMDIDKDIFVLQIGAADRYFRASLARDRLYLPWDYMVGLKRGEYNLPVPVPYRYSGGTKKPEDFIWTDFGFIISERIKRLLTDYKFKGWETYPINLYDKRGSLISGYYGFAITGKAVKIDYSRSKIVAKASLVPGMPNIIKMGIYFNDWDGSDILFAGPLLVTGQVVEALKKASPKIKNWEAIPASKYEWPLTLDAFEPNFLTEEERNIVNQLRRIIKRKDDQSGQRTREIIARGRIHNKEDLFLLLEAIFENKCMFTTMGDQFFCQRALKLICESGRTGITQMIAALRDQKMEVRAGAAWALGKLKAVEAVDQLLQTINDGDEYVRKEAVTALGEIGDYRAVTPLIEILEGEDTPYVRCGAAEALGVIGDISTIQILISILNREEDVIVLNGLTSALGNLAGPEAILPLIGLFEKEDGNLAERVKRALNKIGQPALISLIQALSHSQPSIRRGAADTLGEMGERKAVLSIVDSLMTENDPEVLIFLVQALGQLGDPRAIKPLLSIGNTTSLESLQKEIRIALQKIQVK
jgi:HEAT repeat protein